MKIGAKPLLWGYWSSRGWNGTQLEPTTHCLQDFFNFGKEKFKIFDDNCAALGSSKSNQHCLFDFTSYSNSNDFDIFFLEKELFWYELCPHCTRGFFLSEFLLGLGVWIVRVRGGVERSPAVSLLARLFMRCSLRWLTTVFRWTFSNWSK